MFMGQPVLDLPEDVLPRPSQAPLPVSGEVTSVGGVVHPVEKGEIRRFLPAGYSLRFMRDKGVRLTMS